MRPVIALDVDGTLVDYHAHFTEFAVQYFDLDMEHFAFEKYDARMPFYKYLGISKEKYRQCKMAYRRGELKRSVPLLPQPYPDAPTLTKQLRLWGVDIWLCTTRPYLAYDAIDSATRHNLKRHGISYQGIIWGERKYHELVRTVGRERIVGVLDDLPAMCDQAVRLRMRTALAVRPHNEMQMLGYQGPGTFPGNLPWEAARTHDDTLALFRRWLTDWRGK